MPAIAYEPNLCETCCEASKYSARSLEKIIFYSGGR